MSERARQAMDTQLAMLGVDLTPIRMAREIGRLRAELADIRDSTFRNAVTLRAMADRALTKDPA